jgi:hypothetical protein
MSIDARLGLIGLIVTFFSITAFYFWPDKKWIGGLTLAAGAILIMGWIVFELKQKVSQNWISDRSKYLRLEIEKPPVRATVPACNTSFWLANNPKPCRANGSNPVWRKLERC